MPKYQASASVELREVGQQEPFAILGGVTIEIGDDDLANPSEVVRSVGNALASGFWPNPLKAAGDRRRAECDHCEVPQACAWLADCAKWQRAQIDKR